MDFDSFTEIMMENLRDYLPEDYRDARLTLEEVTKLNETYQSLTITREDEDYIPRINMDSLYERFCIDSLVLLRDAAREIAEAVAREADIKNAMVEATFLDYEKARESLFVRVSSAVTNRELLETLPHREIEGLAITCHLYYGTEDGHFFSAMISEGALEEYGVSREVLLQDALENSSKILPAVFRGLGDPVWEETRPKTSPGMEDPAEGFEEPPLYQLTNRTGINGASALFYPGMMQEVALKLEDSYYVIPSSIHEVLILPESEDADPLRLEEILREANECHVPPNERLSDEVYHYDMKARRFETVKHWQQRTGKRYS